MNIKNLVLGIGIVVVFALVLWQGIEAFYPSPKWDDFCQERIAKPAPINNAIPPATLNKSECLKQGGTWINNYCDFYAECRQNYEKARDAHSRVVFFVSLVVAIIAITLGYTLLSLEPVGSALIGSGIWAIFYGSAINWRNFSNYIRFILLLFALILLIWIAFRLNSPSKKKKFKKRE